jgi:CelD/BcsL family acetyltransferase involved in cellulose biosynthesis
VTHELAIDHYRRAGEREYDFLAGDARYKRTLAKSFRTLHWTVVYRNAAWIRLLFALRDRMRSILPVRPVRGSEG